jgi:phage terminase small subunit
MTMDNQIDNWHSGLTEKQRRFCEAYSGNGGNALAAARSAGYRQPVPQSNENIKKPIIQKAIESLRLTTTSLAIMTRRERQELWSAMIRDESIPTMARLRASELLGKSQGDFIDRQEVTGSFETIPDCIRRIRIDALLAKT